MPEAVRAALGEAKTTASCRTLLDLAAIGHLASCGSWACGHLGMRTYVSKDMLRPGAAGSLFPSRRKTGVAPSYLEVHA